MEKNEKTSVSTATYGIMLLVLVTIGRIQELVPYLDKVHFGKIVFGLCFVLAIAGSRNQANYLTGNIQIKYIIGIFICVLISIPFSYWPGGSLEYVTQRYIKTLVAFLLIITVIENALEIQKIAWALTGSVFALSITALSSGGAGRLSASSTYDPNDLAFVLVTFMPIIYYFMKEKVGVARMALQATLVVMLLALMATGSRGGMVGLAIVVAVMFIKYGKKIIQAILPLTTLLIIICFFAPATFWERMSTIVNPKQDYNMTAGGGRVEIWKKGLDMMLKHPLTGVGINCFEVAEGASHTDITTGNSGKWSSPHNSFVQIGAELGVVALILFIKMLINCIRTLKRCQENIPQNKSMLWILNGTEVSFYGYIGTGFFLSQAYASALFLLVAFVILAQKVQRRTLSDVILK